MNPAIVLDEREVISSEECIKNFLIGNTIEGFSCNKIFGKSLFSKNKIEYT